jgi:hypothetical protein
MPRTVNPAEWRARLRRVSDAARRGLALRVGETMVDTANGLRYTGAMQHVSITWCVP